MLIPLSVRLSLSSITTLQLPDNNYLAKVSDFKSANLKKFATTSGEGAIDHLLCSMANFDTQNIANWTPPAPHHPTPGADTGGGGWGAWLATPLAHQNNNTH